MLKSNMGVHEEILEGFAPKVKNNYSYYLKEYDVFGMTIERPLFSSERSRWFHLLCLGMDEIGVASDNNIQGKSSET